MDPISILMTATPVILAMVSTQVLKFLDGKKKHKRLYFFAAFILGIGFGLLFSTGLTDEERNWVKMSQDAALNGVISCFSFVFMRQLGIRLPGDTGFVAGKFFGYKG
jgi:hypothetical protein